MVSTYMICFVVVYVCISTPEFNKTDSLSLIKKASFLQRKRLTSKVDHPILKIEILKALARLYYYCLLEKCLDAIFQNYLYY